MLSTLQRMKQSNMLWEATLGTSTIHSLQVRAHAEDQAIALGHLGWTNLGDSYKRGMRNHCERRLDEPIRW